MRRRRGCIVWRSGSADEGDNKALALPRRVPLNHLPHPVIWDSFNSCLWWLAITHLLNRHCFCTADVAKSPVRPTCANHLQFLSFTILCLTIDAAECCWNSGENQDLSPGGWHLDRCRAIRLSLRRRRYLSLNDRDLRLIGHSHFIPNLAITWLLSSSPTYAYLINQTPEEKLRHGVALRASATLVKPCKLLSQ